MSLTPAAALPIVLLVILGIAVAVVLIATSSRRKNRPGNH